jgi:hypothetical protein
VLLHTPELADPLTRLSGDLGKLLRTKHQERDNCDDQDVERRERTIERHANTLRPPKIATAEAPLPSSHQL